MEIRPQEGSGSTGCPLSTPAWAAGSGLDVHLCLWGWVNFRREEPRCLGPRGRVRWDGLGLFLGELRCRCRRCWGSLGNLEHPSCPGRTGVGFGVREGPRFHFQLSTWRVDYFLGICVCRKRLVRFRTCAAPVRVDLGAEDEQAACWPPTLSQTMGFSLSVL